MQLDNYKNAWYESGGAEELGSGEMSVQSKGILYGEMGKDFCPNFIEHLLENIDRRSRNDRI